MKVIEVNGGIPLFGEVNISIHDGNIEKVDVIILIYALNTDNAVVAGYKG